MEIKTEAITFDDGSFWKYRTTISTDTGKKIFAGWTPGQEAIVFQSWDDVSDENDFEFEIIGIHEEVGQVEKSAARSYNAKAFSNG
jgi:hypothetical protein